MAPRNPSSDSENGRVQREIEEILEREENRGRVISPAPPPQTPPAHFRPSASSAVRSRITPGALMLASLVLVVSGLLVRKALLPLTAVSLVLFIAGYAWSLSSSRSASRKSRKGGGAPASSGTYWRGERLAEIEPGSRSNVLEFKPGFRARFRRWVRGGRG